MNIHKRKAKNLNAYFHQDGDVTELRIPINKKRRSIIRTILEASDEDSSRLAVNVAGFALNWLDGYQDWATCAAEYYCTDSRKDYDEILRMLSYFERLGWVRSESRQEMLEEIRQRINENDFEPEDMEWARELVGTAA